MSFQPDSKVFSSDFTCCQLHNYPFLLIHISSNLKSIEQEENFHSRVADALVTIYERMILD